MRLELHAQSIQLGLVQAGLEFHGLALPFLRTAIKRQCMRQADDDPIDWKIEARVHDRAIGEAISCCGVAWRQRSLRAKRWFAGRAPESFAGRRWKGPARWAAGFETLVARVTTLRHPGRIKLQRIQGSIASP